MSFIVYLKRVKKLWNLAPAAKCTRGLYICGGNKAITETSASAQRMQFLMGLHESFDKEKSQLNSRENRREGAARFMQRRKPVMDKRNLICSNCHKTGHLKETCFQLHGVPDWYKSLNDEKKKGVSNNNFAGNVEEKPVVPVVNQDNSVENKSDMADLVSEILNLVQHRNIPLDPITNFANYAQCDDEFA
ncbi:UNVERIFIED_CONTAM: hypothetical protein Slati_1698300, partial [Sesamum latifolium]